MVSCVGSCVASCVASRTGDISFIVAALAEVSTGTVSNTINHPERVHPRTRAAVERAIRTLGFVPNQQARVLTGASSNVIGLGVLDVESPFYMEAAHAIERVARWAQLQAAAPELAEGAEFLLFLPAAPPMP